LTSTIFAPAISLTSLPPAWPVRDLVLQLRVAFDREPGRLVGAEVVRRELAGAHQQRGRCEALAVAAVHRLVGLFHPALRGGCEDARRAVAIRADLRAEHPLELGRRQVLDAVLVAVVHELETLVARRVNG